MQTICGIDEAGRGPLAGPVYVAAVVFADGKTPIDGLDDSKKLTAAKRDQLALEIKACALAWSIVAIDEATIDRINILQATLSGMTQTFLNVRKQQSIHRIVIDGTQLPSALKTVANEQSIKLEALAKADATVPAVSAASILAKTARDQHMCDMELRYPGYGFAQHKGYGTAQHLDALALLGPCAIHRKTFAPIAQRSLDL